MKSQNNSRLILIGGGTCSGKTTIARAIGKRLQSLKHVIISHDNYYNDLSHLTREEALQTNFDHPDAIDVEYLLYDINAMLAGSAVNVPDYDFINHSRSEGNLCVANADVIILEGIFA
ncbi:MAG: uridine kinase, partial [Candidatus Cloacimonadaceae bacterium]|nr:uridine kinase [Candidatus Cloacimonadaceae bacterium]